MNPLRFHPVPYPRPRALTLSAALILALTAGDAAAQADAKAKKDGSAAPEDTSIVVRAVDFVAHPVLEVVTWPLQNVVGPGVELATAFTQPPIRYFIEENVIDRSVGLFQFGTTDDFSVYPTVSLASGTASRTGATLRHDGYYGDSPGRTVSYFHYYVNGDYRWRSFFTIRDIAETRLRAKLAFGLNRFDNDYFYQPVDHDIHFHKAHYETYELQLEYPVIGEYFARGGFTFRNNRYGDAPPAISRQPDNALTSDFFRNEDGLIDPALRGLGQSFHDRVWQLGVVRDTRTNENIPLEGSRFEAVWYFHDADLDHRFHRWRATWRRYYKLGPERYEFTPAELRRRGPLSVQTFVRSLEYQRLREAFLSRRVLVLHLSAGRSYELPGNHMPVYGTQSLGNSTPLRAYSGSRFRDYALAAAGAEYRFPILRIMDGTFFNEYGVVGPAFTELDPGADLRNSWGFGIRVRQPDMFLFRIEMAFNGFSGAVLNVSSETPF